MNPMLLGLIGILILVGVLPDEKKSDTKVTPEPEKKGKVKIIRRTVYKTRKAPKPAKEAKPDAD